MSIPGSVLPTISSSSMSNVHTFVGSSFFLPCETDRLADTYQWFRSGIEIHTNSHQVIETGLGLRVMAAQKSDSGVYLCVARNDAGSVNVTVVVDVTNSVLTCDG